MEFPILDLSTVVALFVGALLGGLLSWLITHRYYVKSNEEQRILYDKLSQDVRIAILNASSKNISKNELDDILKNINIDGGAF